MSEAGFGVVADIEPLVNALSDSVICFHGELGEMRRPGVSSARWARQSRQGPRHHSAQQRGGAYPRGGVQWIRPVVGQFLGFLARDIAGYLERLQSVDAVLLNGCSRWLKLER